MLTFTVYFSELISAPITQPITPVTTNAKTTMNNMHTTPFEEP
jgi:hypothetical protein